MKRAKRLLIPYFIYRIFWMVPMYTILDVNAYGRPEGSSLLYGYKSMLMGQFNDVSWFLIMLFWVSTIWIILRKLLKKERIVIGAVVAIILMMGICKFNFVDRIASTPTYKWLLKHNMDVYLMQAPAIYRSFKILYPIIGQNCFLCIISCFMVTIVIDFVLVWILTKIKNVFMGQRK